MKALLKTMVVLLLAGFFVTGCGDDPAAPGAIVGFSVAQGYEVNAIAVSWNAAAGATGYEVQRSLFGETAYTLAGTSSTTNFTDTNVLVGENWHYRVRTVGDGGAGAWTEPIMGYCAGKRVVALTNTLFDDTQFARFCSLAVDGRGKPMVGLAVQDAGYRFHLYHADPLPGRTWSMEPVMQSNGGRWHSLVLDDQGRPHYVYHQENHADSSGDMFGYAYRDGGVWSSEIAVSNIFHGEPSCALALDNAGQPCFSFCNDENGGLGGYGLHYASRNAGTWSVTGLNADDCGYVSSLGIDAAGNPHIVSWNQTTSALQHNYHNGSIWQQNDVTAMGQPGSFPDVAFDGSGRPAVSYYGANMATLEYTVRDGTTWSAPVQAALNVVSHTGLAFDSAGLPVIAYCGAAGGTNGLALARYTGSAWTNIMLDPGGDNCGLFLSFKLDPYDRVHISYYDKVSKEIRYLCWLP